MAEDADEFELSLRGYGRLAPPARAKVREVLEARGERALSEAARLESEWRGDPGDQPEITARDVSDAFRLMDRIAPRKKTRRQQSCDVTAFASAFFGGVFGNNISTPVGAVGFAICALIGILAYSNRGEA
jgi:hypothetical protein